jgi:N utilization substance protein A
MNKDFILALNDLEKEKNIPKDMLLEALKAALVAAYKKNYGQTGNIRVDIDEETAYVAIITIMDVVDEIEDETRQISLEEAHSLDPRYVVGDQIEFEVTPEDFGRVAAQTAKQVVVQRIREAERNMVYEDFKDRQGEIVTGTVHRKRGKTLFIDLGQTEGILPAREQVPGEHFNIYDRLKVYIMDVKNAYKGPQIFLSRSHPGIVKRLFELEVPELQDGTVVIKGIAREAGSRTKIAVASSDENVDPVGACVGTRGSRVQAVVDELSGEKIDVIAWSEDPEELIGNVLSPAKVEKVFLEETDDGDRLASVIVPDYQLSLAIGKEGQNVRLAAKVSDWKIDIKSHTQYYGEDEAALFDDASNEEGDADYRLFDTQKFADAIDEVEAGNTKTENTVDEQGEKDKGKAEIDPEEE